MLLQLALEIESQALSAQREISIVKATIAAKQRDVRMLELTCSELNHLSKETKVYEGIGKMSVTLFSSSFICVRRNCSVLRICIKMTNDRARFVFNPTENVKKRFASDVAELKSEISNLNKKLHYLEMTHKNSREHIDRIFRSAGKS